MTPSTRVVAFGGGHGLGASLRALRLLRHPLDLDITAVVTVGDDGGSSGRLRADRGGLPPGDLRQALAALADPDDPVARHTAELMQYRFHGDDALAGHPVGNLVLCGLMELAGDPVTALDRAAAMVRSVGRVLPMSRHPVGIEADVRGGDPDRPDDVIVITGQHEVAVSRGTVERVRLHPPEPVACTEAVAAITGADWLIFGPGSWYTSVIPHLLVPGGWLVCELPTRKNLERHARPSARWLLDEGELARLVMGLEIVRLEEGWSAAGRHEARVVARKSA